MSSKITNILLWKPVGVVNHSLPTNTIKSLITQLNVLFILYNSDFQKMIKIDMKAKKLATNKKLPFTDDFRRCTFTTNFCL